MPYKHRPLTWDFGWASVWCAVGRIPNNSKVLIVLNLSWAVLMQVKRWVIAFPVNFTLRQSCKTFPKSHYWLYICTFALFLQ